jgi:hypothetical protein
VHGLPEGSSVLQQMRAMLNAQAAVDSAAQIIVAAEITQQTNDKQQLEWKLICATHNLLKLFRSNWKIQSLST